MKTTICPRRSPGRWLCEAQNAPLLKKDRNWEKLRVAISSPAGIMCSFPPGVLVDFWRVTGRAKDLGEISKMRALHEGPDAWKMGPVF